MLNNFFLSEKKLLNAIFRTKLNYMKKIISNEMNSFLQCRRQIFMCLSFFAEKVICYDQLVSNRNMKEGSRKTFNQ